MRGDTILIIDDDKLIRWALRQELAEAEFRVLEADTVATGLTLLNECEPDIVILDQMLPDGTGIDVLREIQREKFVSPVIMLTAIDRSDVAVQALKLGAYDYVTKPLNMEIIKAIVAKALDSTKLKRQVAHYLKLDKHKDGFCGLIGSSPPMKKVRESIEKIAWSNTTTVLITGESGTGKELVARAIHALGDRRAHPLITVNFSEFSETLIESELFGHEKGAFTDAKHQKKGVFELADGGTIFLDEIGDISPKIQVKLLRVLEQRTFKRVGGTSDITVDLRIIAATNRPLDKLVQEGVFRPDLFYRLNVARINLPPLSDRGDDVIMLSEIFLHEFSVRFNKHFKGLSDETKMLFRRYSWPGNVRELRNVIERAVILDDGDYVFSHHVELGHLHQLEHVPERQTSRTDFGQLSLAEVERKTILEALESVGYNQTYAARKLGITRSTLIYRMKKYNILPPTNNTSSNTTRD